MAFRLINGVIDTQKVTFLRVFALIKIILSQKLSNLVSNETFSTYK